MSDVLPNTQHDFWRPPVVAQAASASSAVLPAMVEVCDGCGTEFMVGARFCHACGATRQAQALAGQSWTRYLEFHNIKQGLGLSTASLIAFFTGLACVAAAILVGLIYSVQNFADFQAIQLWRMEWLLGAVAAFGAGCLLKRAEPHYAEVARISAKVASRK